MSTVIVTGGAGFIGGNFIHYYLREHPEDRVVCVDKLTYAGNLSNLAPVMDNPNFRFCKLDICDREGINKLFSEELPDIVINFAAESHVDRSIENPGIFLTTNIIGTSVMMDACRKFVEMIQSRQGITISAPEEIGYINGWIDKAGLLKSAEAYGKSPYGAHLKAVAEGRVKY